MSEPTVHSLPRILTVLSVALLLVAGAASAAAPTKLKAKVVWVRGDRVYVASAESLALEEDDLLRFQAHGKEIAAGKVIDVRDQAMIVASLTSGSFRKEKKLEKIRVLAERPPLRALPSLRVGCPSRSRPSLLFACDSATIGAALPHGAYRADTLSRHSYRFVRDSTVALAAPWPDTLLVRGFDESADEEIALERGELDVAVFWPGELSTHVREDARWGERLYGIRSQGALFAASSEPGFGDLDARSALGTMNRAIFRGDLAPWTGSANRSAAGDTPIPPSPASDMRLEIDRTMPGFAAIEHALNEGAKSIPSTARRTIRIFYAGVRVTAHGAAIPETAGITFLSAIRCPVISNLKLRRIINALGPNAFADLLGCGDGHDGSGP